MKKTIIIFLFFLPCFSNSQDFKVWKGDTINKKDENNLKQGRWIFFQNERNVLISKEGDYINSKKNGIWIDYYLTGIKKSEITFKVNKKNGFAKIYYENGKIKEEGIWKKNKWVGEYKYYHENGNPYYLWNYDDTGQRSGTQKYFYKNGNLMIEGKWTGGKESGVIKEYYENGSLKAEKSFENGNVDIASLKTYKKKEKLQVTTNKTDTLKNTVSVIEKKTTQNHAKIFDGNGYHKLYNKFKKIKKEGDFINGLLFNGKHFIYDSKGNLIKEEYIEKGKIEKIITIENAEKN